MWGAHINVIIKNGTAYQYHSLLQLSSHVKVNVERESGLFGMGWSNSCMCSCEFATRERGSAFQAFHWHRDEISIMHTKVELVRGAEYARGITVCTPAHCTFALWIHLVVWNTVWLVQSMQVVNHLWVSSTWLARARAQVRVLDRSNVQRSVLTLNGCKYSRPQQTCHCCGNAYVM